VAAPAGEGQVAEEELRRELGSSGEGLAIRADHNAGPVEDQLVLATDGVAELAMDHLFSGFTQFSVFGAPVGFWELLNGCFACSYFRGFGTRSWASSEPSGLVLRSSRPSRSSRFLPDAWEKICGRISRNDGHGRFPYEGHRPSGAMSIFAAAGPNQSVTFEHKFSPIVCGSRLAAI